MENNSTLNHHVKDDEQLELPPGFRFHPTDEELITHYLSQKVLDNCFCARAIGEVDLNKCEPWDLPWRAKMGEKEWYFFCVRDRKYPTGLRTNRATDAGYWKATGKDKEIYRAKTLVGMKKTLVFYKGRAPKGTKTNWVMHEYRLEGKYSHNSCFSFQHQPTFANLQYQDSVLMPEQQFILRMLLDNQGPNLKQTSKMEISHDTGLRPDMSSVIINPEMVQRSFDDQEGPLSSAGPVYLDCLWSY
eukprot:XP_015583259.1 NAC domain-containing protein 100 [Ricinus communis]